MTQLFYNNQLIASGQPTPIVGRDDSMILYGERWADAQTITLKGSLTGCPIDGYNDLVAAQQNLLNIFSKDFQNFKIVEEGATIFSKDFCILQGGVQFSSSNYVGKIDYTIPILCYPPEYFSGTFGVLDPSNVWEFEETNDKRYIATHKISARGFNTSSGASNGFQNAINFCNSKSGAQDISAFFITGGSGLPICLKKIVERPNRFNGSYSLELSYEGDLYYRSGVLLRYTSDYNCDPLVGIAKLNINGNIEGCFDAGMDVVRQRYSGFNVLGAAQSEYFSINGQTDLNSGYLSSGISEDSFKRTLAFNVSFDNFTGSNAAFLDYSVNISSGENDIVSVGVEGDIRARGELSGRWSKVQAYYTSGINLFGIGNTEYNSIYGSTYPLNPYPLSSGLSQNPFIGEIRVRAQFDNKENTLSGNIGRLEYSELYVPAVPKLSAQPLLATISGLLCSDNYAVTNLNYTNRVSYALNGNFILTCGGSMTGAIAQVKAFGNSNFLSKCPTSRCILERNNISTGLNSANFDFLWSADSSNRVMNTGSSYILIDNLSIV